MIDRVQEIIVFSTTSQEKIRFPHDGGKNGISPARMERKPISYG